MASQFPPDQAPFPPDPFPGDDPGQPAKQPSSGLAVTSLVIGIIGFGAWCLPICGLPLSIGGLITGIMGMKSPGRGMAIAGVILNVLGLIAGIANAAYGAYLGATGQHPFFQ